MHNSRYVAQSLQFQKRNQEKALYSANHIHRPAAEIVQNVLCFQADILLGYISAGPRVETDKSCGIQYLQRKGDEWDKIHSTME